MVGQNKPMPYPESKEGETIEYHLMNATKAIIGIPTREFGHCSDGAISKECQRLHHPCLGNEDYADEDR